MHARLSTTLTAGLKVLLFVLLLPLSAAAQGPLTIEPVGSGWAATPEVKQTEVDHRAGTLVGGNVGWVADETFFVGGAGYWLANGSHDRQLGYGGFLMQWIGRGSDRIGFAAKALVGGGTGTITDTVTTYVIVPPVGGQPSQSRPQPVATRPVTQQLRVRTDFVVFEPQADVHVRFASWARLTVGAGYRFIGDYGNRRDAFNSDDRLQGWVGTLGVQFGGGF